MAKPESRDAKAPSIERDALRIVLFGLPHAGKSSLLGALAQAAQSQETLLAGRLADTSGGLADLRRRVYDEKPGESLEEVVPYPATFEAATGARHALVLMDCDGKVANDLLSRRRRLDPESPEGTLARAILEADALVLVVDAASEQGQLEADFIEFVRFLHLLEQSRGQQAEVGGLPVFLVLAKCDLLVEAKDSPASWMERIEEKKRQVDQRFREFLEEDEDEEPLAFGSVDLHLWAIAIKRPDLPGAPAKVREPYGVAELFRQCFAYAAAHRQRERRSSMRLLWTLAGSAGVVAVMAGLAFAFLANRPEDSPHELLTKVDIYRSREGQTPSARLREPLQPKISELTELRADAKFQALPADTQAYIGERLGELKEYRAFKERLLQVRAPAQAQSERDVREIETSLKDLGLPPGRQTEWSQTEAALFRDERLEDLKRLRAAATELEDWYRRLARRGDELWTFSEQRNSKGAPIPWAVWQNQVAGLLDQADAPPHRPAERLPGSTAVSYTSGYRFDKVVEARGEWEAIRQRLLRLRDLSAALGLAGRLPGRPALLEIPAGFTAEQARTRLQELERAYPRYQQDFVLSSELPEVVDAEIRRAARTNYGHLLESGREVVARRLAEASPDGKETPESWRRLRSWLAAPEELQAWRVLASVLLRLQKSGETDPVTSLERFLRQDRFDVELRHLTLEIPEEWKMRPVGRFTLHQRVGEEVRPPLTYELAGDARRDPQRGVMIYGLRPTAATTFAYRPGDLLWADLPLKDAGNADWALTWARSRSLAYQLERLTQPPRLHRKDQENIQGKIAEGVTLLIVPEQGVPTVPDLVPAIRSEKR